jgi:outer membrane lipoprotein-sorting protein
MKLKLLALIIGLVTLSAFGQATKMSAIMANYTNYNIPIVSDNTIEINSIQALSGVEGNVDLAPTNKPLVLVLVEPRLMNSFTGSKYQLADLQNRLKQFKQDLVNDGKYGLVLSTSVYAGSVRQDGLTCLALRRFFKDVLANYPLLEGVIFVGRFPECSEVRRVAWGYGWGQVRDQSGTLVQDFSSDGAILCINTGVEAPRTDIPLADLDGNWESRYRASLSAEQCFIKPNNVVTTNSPWTEWSQTSFLVTGTKWAFQPGINQSYVDVFYVDDAVYSTPVINNGTISVTVTSAAGNYEVSATDMMRPTPMAMPDIYVSRINPNSASYQEDSTWRDINGQSLYDASGKPQAVASQPPARTFSQDLERTLLVEYFDNNHSFRSGTFYYQPFDYGSAANALGTAAGTSALLANARPDWYQENDAVESPAAGTTPLNTFADWFNQNVPVRYIMAHANSQLNAFATPNSSDMIASVGNPCYWVQSGSQWVPSWVPIGGSAGFDFYRALWKNKKISDQTSPSLVFNGGCEAATPVGENGSTTTSYLNFGSGQNSESLLFYGKTIGAIARARIFYDQLEGWQSYTYGNSYAMFGDIWRKNYESLSGRATLLNEDRSAGKRAYWWVLFGDYTLKLRYVPCDGVQGGGNGLQGTVFGLNPPYAAGSEYCKATDGDINTFYDYSQANGAYTGLSFKPSMTIGKIRYYPRANFASRMVGGKFQGSNDAVSYDDLYTITTTPAMQWNEVTVSNPTAYRFVRYLSPDGGYGNIAEMEFYGLPCTITASADGNGTISPSGSVTVASCASQTFTITPNSGYLVSSVMVDGVDQGAITSYTFNNVIANHSISASMTISEFLITASAGPNGSISPSGYVKVLGGSNQTFTITPNSGYQVSAVTVDGVNLGAITSYTFNNISVNHSVSAAFTATIGPKYEAENATLSGGAKMNTNHAGYGGTGFVDGFINNTTAQAAFTVYVQSAGMYYVKLHYSAGNGTSANTGLYVNGTKVKNITCPGTYNWDAWSDETETVPLNAGNNTIAYKAEVSSASCINLDYIIVDYAGTLTYTITASAGANGTISPSGSVVVNGGASQAFTITANSGYKVSAVTVDGASQGAITTYTFSNVTANHTISAAFVLNLKLEAETGTLSGGANKNTNHANYSGTGFVDGYYTSTSAKDSFTVNAPIAGSYKVTLHYSAGNGASSNTGLYINGTKLKNISCPATTNWDIWSDETETVTLKAGNNGIVYKAETSSASCVNLDYIVVSQ